MKNRLNLDFSIQSITDRKAFIDTYLQTPQFKNLPPTKEELETIANYILWGKEEDGKSLVQKKQIQIKTKNSTWTSQSNLSSLDELFESPTFNEFQLSPLYETHYTAQKETFSRSNALRDAPPHIKVELQKLFRQIDTLDLLINFYELRTGKRKNPPREALLQEFSNSEQLSIQERSAHLRPYEYLKCRHELVELRKSQFTFRDIYRTPIVRRTLPVVTREEKPALLSEIQVYPFGLIGKTPIRQKIFRPLREISPLDFSEEELQKVSNLYWSFQEEKKETSKSFLDLEKLEHLYRVLEEFQNFFREEDRQEIFFSEKTQDFFRGDLNREVGGSESRKVEIPTSAGALQFSQPKSSPDFDEDNYINELIDTIIFYIKETDLTDIQKEILDLKLRKIPNQNIAKYINEKYEKNYTANYISTIYKQKIIKQTCDTVRRHREIIENLWFPEEFKVCTRCKQSLLKNTDYFIKKSRTKDGFSSRCKKCDKEVIKPRKKI